MIDEDRRRREGLTEVYPSTIENPTHLYHGTTGPMARRALEEGLLPRAQSGSKGNWEQTASNPDVVYLTTGYAPFYALRSLGEEDSEFGIVEIILSGGQPWATP